MQKNILLLSLLWGLSIIPLAANNKAGKLLDRLDEALALRPEYDAAKQRKIDTLVHLSHLSEDPYIVYHDLYEEYKSFNYDKALYFAEKMANEAQRTGDTERITESKIAQAFVFLSGGLFHESYQLLSSIAAPSAGPLSDFYLLTFARLLYDMCDYAGDAAVSAQYNEQAAGYMQALAQHYTPSDSAKYWYPLAVVDMHLNNYERSIHRMEEAMLDSRNTLHERAIMASSLAYLYRQTGDEEKAFNNAVEAAVYDSKSSTYEAVALRVVAEMLYEQNEFELANRYIHIAMQDANRYHARHRQVSISLLLPIIENHYSEQARRHTVAAYVLLAVVLVLLLIGIGGIIALSRQNKAVRAARQTIDTMNHSLVEANKLKEEMLGTLLVGQSQFLNAVGQYQQEVKQNAVNHRWSALLSIPKQADAHRQRSVLDRQLDTILLSLYPTFVQDFNALLKPDEQLSLKKDELLNAQLRIFALIRLGITHNEVIAEILDYSINTVYSYKTRVIAQSELPSDAFYEALMQIPSFSRNG